jgi:pseudouridylate synthase
VTVVDTSPIRVAEPVAAALAAGTPVVALESTIVAHGLPRPSNLAVAREIEARVAGNGAVPATIGMIDGELIVGLDDPQLTRLATADEVAKLSVRDLAVAAAAGVDGATTVAATAAVAARVGITVFATGGLGGVHRAAPGEPVSYDESADLTGLADTPIVVVCSGVKSILDVGATLERLDSLRITVVGYRTHRFPGFYLTDSGYPLDWAVDSPEQVAGLLAARRAHDLSRAAVVVANPIPVDQQLDPAEHDRVLASGLAGLARDQITGKAVTPYLLEHFHTRTRGASLAVNIAVILGNAQLAAQIAVAVSRS